MTENNINEVIEDIRRTMSPLAEEKGLELIVRPCKELPLFRFDKDRITQVLVNIVNNAVKFTTKGSITITLAADANTVRVSVKDTGPGIPKKDMPKLFGRFEQFGEGGEKQTGGTGLGLAISKEIIARHKGKIWAESEPGKGTTFHFTLPIKERRG